MLTKKTAKQRPNNRSAAKHGEYQTFLDSWAVLVQPVVVIPGTFTPFLPKSDLAIASREAPVPSGPISVNSRLIRPNRRDTTVFRSDRPQKVTDLGIAFAASRACLETGGDVLARASPRAYRFANLAFRDRFADTDVHELPQSLCLLPLQSPDMG